MASTSSLRMLSSNLKKASVSISRSTFGTRNLHKRRDLLYQLAPGQGLGKFLPAEALKVAVEWQDGLLERLNEEVKGTPDENQTVSQTVINTSSARERTLAFNYASLALNNGYFLDNIKPPPANVPTHEHEISSELLAAINSQYGSVRQLKSTFSAAGLGLFSNGWVWLVTDSKGNLAVLPTLGPGTLLVQSRGYRAAEAGLTFGESVLRQGATAAAPTTKSPLPGVAPSSPTSGVSSPTTPRPQEPAAGPRFLHTSSVNAFEPLKKPSSLYGSSANPGSLSSIINVGEVLYPLFTVPIYEHSWMSAGYGVWGKEQWLKEFWTVVDWAKASKSYKLAKNADRALVDGSPR